MFSEDQKKIIAADQLKKQPIQTVSAALFLAICDLQIKENGSLLPGTVSVLSMPIQSDGKKYMAEAQIIFKPM